MASTPLWAVKSTDNARAAATHWGGHRRHFGGRAGAGIERIARHSPTGGDEFFSVKFAGGGTAFVAGDGEDELPIAFTTSTNDFSSIDRNSPLWALLERDAKVRRLAGVRRPSMALGDSKIISDSAISDMRVPPLVQSKWSQEGGIYNYYTPNNYVCGCVATAMSQVMRYHQYPTEPRAQITRTCQLNGNNVSYTTQGGLYDWGNMPFEPSSPSEAQKQAIGKLTSDAGIAVYMKYTSDGSGAYDLCVPDALRSGFGYGSAVYCEPENLESVLVSGVFANLEAGFPVIFGIMDSASKYGHCIVGDGYGYDGGLPYVHLNFGWGGDDDMWYNLPNIGTSYNFSVIEDLVANIFPTNVLGSVIIAGRVTNGDVPRSGVKVILYDSASDGSVAELVANEYGVWGAVVTAGTYRVVAENDDGEVAVTSSVSVVAQPYNVEKSYGYDNGVSANGFSNVGDIELVLSSSNQVRVPTVDVNAGIVVGSTNVALSCVTEGAEIRYTMDGAVPSASANLYVGPIVIDQACTLKARAFKDGMEDSPVMSVTYGWQRYPRTVTVATDGTGEYSAISSAVADAVSGDVISAGPGIYHGCVEIPENVALAVVASEGPDRTFIDGDGKGCCFYGYESPGSTISGFTLTNGWDNYGGGIWGGIASNCVIRNCYSKYGGGGADSALLIDCIIADCITYGQGGGASLSTLVNCTVRGNSARAYRTYRGRNYSLYTGGGLDCDCLCTNTVVWGNYGPSGGTDDWEWYREQYWDPRYGYYYGNYAPTFQWCCTSDRILWGDNSITDDPLFVSVDAADPRMYEISPCIGSGYGGVNIGAYRGAGEPKVLPKIDIATATGEEVAAAVASVGYADESVAEGIGTNAETYAEFQVWSTNGLASKAVCLSEQAYDSFLVRDLVAAPTLLTGGANTELEVSAPEPSENGQCSVTISLVDGDTVVPLRAAKEAFAAKTLIGSDLLGLLPADASKVTAATAEDGKSVTLTIEPPAATQRFFMWLKLD